MLVSLRLDRTGTQFHFWYRCVSVLFNFFIDTARYPYSSFPVHLKPPITLTITKYILLREEGARYDIKLWVRVGCAS